MELIKLEMDQFLLKHEVALREIPTKMIGMTIMKLQKNLNTIALKNDGLISVRIDHGRMLTTQL